MNLSFFCTDCSHQDPTGFHQYFLPVRDDGAYELRCQRGHHSICLIHEEKHEVLFKIAIDAFCKGSYRDAILSGAASAERFFEHFIRAAYKAHGIDPAASESSWKSIKRQSERQLGAYVVLHTITFGRPPPIMSETQTRLRNEVAHNGHIPTRETTFTYLEHIMGNVVPVVTSVRSDKDLRAACLDLQCERIQAAHAALGKAPVLKIVTHGGIQTPIGILSQSPQLKTLQDYVKIHEARSALDAMIVSVRAKTEPGTQAI